MLTLAEEQRHSRRVTVFGPTPGGAIPLAQAAGIEVATAFRSGEQMASGYRRYMRIVLGLNDAAKRSQADVLHVNLAPGVRYGWPVAKWRRIPLVAHQRDNFRRDRFHFGLGGADHIIAISQSVFRTLPSDLQRRTTVIPNAVRLPELDLSANDRSELRIGMAGRPIPEKGFDLLIDAARQIAAPDGGSLHLWGLEPGTAYSDQIRHAAMSLRSRGWRLDLQGFRADMDRFYRDIDVVVVPSRFPEPFGRMAIEAMAWGKPVVAAAHGGLTEIVDEGRTGLLFSPGDSSDLARKLGLLLRDPSLRAEIARAGRSEVEQRFSPAAHARAVDEVYRLVLDR